MIIENRKQLWFKPEVTEIAIKMTEKKIGDDPNCVHHGHGNANGKTGTYCDGFGQDGGHS